MTLKLISTKPKRSPAHRSDAYAALKFRAVVDWVELHVVTASPSNFDTARKRVGVPHVKPVNPGPGGAATEFLVRLQEPESWQDVEEALAGFTHDHPLAEPVTVHAIEIALDAYSRFNSRDDLVEMAYGFYKFSTFMASENRRMSRGKLDTLSLRSHRLRRHHLDEGYNVYVGDKGADVMQHLYVKETTIREGLPVSLPRKEHRARTEITFTGKGVPEALVSDWREFNFTELSSYFSYRKLKPILTPLVRVAVEHVDQIGEAKLRRRRNRGTRLHSAATLADTELNARAYSALRELTKRMRAGGKLGSLAA
ncbi:hypothetical protein [Thiomonas sp. FB-6]|uniref:hypothetical protein n=1 Tax=Thiomonas sp. FB-6 TaxID=1158291 RepID=UPI00037E7E20|nr:hypothetical protein [Thiomonas sp. FB-6]